jgi:hypothetical protein
MNNPAVQFCIKAVRDGLLGNVFDLDTSMGRYDGASYRSLIKTYKGGAPSRSARYTGDQGRGHR